MRRWPRAAAYLIIATLWITGCTWLLLEQLIAKRGPFGVIPHPLEPPLLLIHGVAALFSLYLLGWISAHHVLRWWTRRLRRVSGGILATLLAVLALSGFALFFLSDDRWLHAMALVHEILGVALTVFAIQHFFFRGRWTTRTL